MKTLFYRNANRAVQSIRNSLPSRRESPKHFVLTDETEVSSDLLLDSSSSRRRVWLENICYGLGHVYNDLCASMWFSYTLFYFQIVLQMESTSAGMLIMLGQVIDAVATPVAGWAVDKTGTHKAWHAAGSLLVTIGFSLIYSVKALGNDLLTILIYAGLISLFQIGWALVQISHLAMIPSLAKDSRQSNSLTTIRYTASVCCGIIVYLTTWIVLKEDSNLSEVGPEDFYRFRKIMFIITSIGLVATVIFYAGLRSNWTAPRSYDNLEEADATEEIPKAPTSFLKSSVTYKVSLLYMTSRLYTTLNLIYIPLYLDERRSDSLSSIDGVRSTVAAVPFVVYIVSFVTSIVLNFRKQKCGDMIVYLWGSLFSLSASMWIAIGGRSTSKPEVYGIANMIGIGGSATMITSLCLTAKHVKINDFGGASVYSVVTFTDKLASGVVVFVIQHLQNSLIKDLPNFYANVLAYACGGSTVLGLLSLGALYICASRRNNSHIII